MKFWSGNRYPKHVVGDLTLRQQFFIFIWELIKVVVISLVIIIPVRYYLIKPFYVKGASMEPNFHDYEYLIIDEISYRFSQPQRGDVVVFRYPDDPSQFFIKRTIGLPGERIKIANNQVTIYNQTNPQGVALVEPYLATGLQTFGNIDLRLTANQYYLLGDNRPVSLDSRIFGPVPRHSIIGHVLLRGWPIDRFGLLNTEVNYNLKSANSL